MSLNDDAYDLWLENAVTREFLESAKQELSDLMKEDRVSGRSIEEIAMNAIATQSKIDCLEKLISWRPKHG